MAGRSLFTKKSGFQGTEIGDQSFYNDKNQLIKIATTDKPATLFIYDDLSNQIMQGLDIDQDGQLSPASDDMILQMESKYLKAGNTWVWQNQKNTYGTSNSDIVTLLNTTQDILTLGTGELSKQLDIDINGNTTTVATTVNRAQKLVTVSTTSPESSVAVQNVLQNGLSISERTSSNLTYTFNYDGLQRLTGITDPRIGTTAVAYHTTPGKFGLKASVTDPAGNIITYDYNGLGQLIEIKNALEQYSRYAYNTRGQLTKIWGARYPITLEYDNFGQQTKLTTYRNTTADFFGTGFPTVTGDVTTWVYDNASGLVMQKLDAENLATIYTYTATGNLASRTWARGITTNYTYNELDKLLTIDYSDETPDISYTYTRLRQLAGVTDAAGTRTFAYNDQFSLTNETINGIYNKELHARIRPAV